MIQVVSSTAAEGCAWLITFFADVNWSQFIAATLSAFFAAGAVSYFSNRSLNKRDKLQLEREERKEQAEKQKEEKRQRQKEINACNFYTNSVYIHMYDLFSLATQEKALKNNLRNNPPIKPNTKFLCFDLSQELYNLIANISDETITLHFESSLYIKRINEAIDHLLRIADSLEKYCEIIQKTAISTHQKLMAEKTIKNAIRAYIKEAEEIYYNVKMNTVQNREGLFTLATRSYINIFISLCFLQYAANNKKIELDITKNGMKYFDQELVNYFETPEAIRIIESKKIGFSHSILIRAYKENPNDILNAAERLAGEEA